MAVEYLGGIADTGMNIAMILLSSAILIGVIAATWWIAGNAKKYSEFKVVIWEKDGFGQWSERYDNAGVFVDKKTNNKRFFLKKNKVGLNADNVPYLPSKPNFLGGGGKTVHMIRTGLKNFHFVKINPAYPKVTLSVGEEDVNWAINSYERQKKLFQQSWLMQALPYISLIFVGAVVLIVSIYIVQKWEVLLEISKEMVKVAETLVRAKTGVIPTE